MSSIKVSALTAKTTPSGSEELLINDGGTSKKITIDNVTENNFTDTLKSKLDAIEASADVTDTTNVTSAGALMDSEVTNLAAVKAFATSDYATSTQGTTADAALPKAGGTMTGTIAGFTSTGIDDNATSTAITIDASENVGFTNQNTASNPIVLDSNGKMPSSLISGAYGVSWNQSTDTYTGLGDSLLRSTLPIQSAMKRCVVKDSGEVAYYLDSSDSTLKENGDTATIDGTDGQVMVQVPKFYYKHTYTSNLHSWQISLSEEDGFAVHPAFIKNGVEVDHRYFGAYEASSASSKMGSVSGQCAAVSKTRTTFRSEASARGTGWRQVEYYLHSAIQLLYLVEYQDFNSQEMIGQGRTQLSGGSWACDSYIGRSGKSNADGNGTNSVAGNTNNAYMTYRGIENWYGNVWEMRDGWTVNDVSSSQLIMYATNNDADFADTGSTNMTVIYDDTSPHASGGYISGLADISNGFIGNAMSGASNTYVGDYYYQYAGGSGWSLPAVGATATNGSQAGAFTLHVDGASSYSYVNRSSRLAF